MKKTMGKAQKKKSKKLPPFPIGLKKLLWLPIQWKITESSPPGYWCVEKQYDPLVPSKGFKSKDPGTVVYQVADKWVSLKELMSKREEYGVSEEELDSMYSLYWRGYGAGQKDIYITAAFRSSTKNEAYIFMGELCLRVNYAKDRIVRRALFVDDWFPNLRCTLFNSRRGIDCAFACHRGNKAFIFCHDACARIDYKRKVMDYEFKISAVFPLVEGSAFESDLDAAFEAEDDKAYLFKGNQYAHINYEQRTDGITFGTITEKFPDLKGTKFEDGIGAAFASHRKGQAYLFQEDYFALVDFENNRIIEQVDKIENKWSRFGRIVPRKIEVRESKQCFFFEPMVHRS